MEIQKVIKVDEEELLEFVFSVYRGTSGQYPKMEWLREEEKPGLDDFEGFKKAYGEFMKFRLQNEFDELYVIRENKIIATFALVYRAKENFPWLIRDDKCVFLEFFMVHPEYQGRGLGREIVKESRRIAKEMHRELCVSTFEDLSAYHFYLNIGFREVKRKDEYVILKI